MSALYKKAKDKLTSSRSSKPLTRNESENSVQPSSNSTKSIVSNSITRSKSNLRSLSIKKKDKRSSKNLSTSINPKAMSYLEYDNEFPMIIDKSIATNYEQSNANETDKTSSIPITSADESHLFAETNLYQSEGPKSIPQSIARPISTSPTPGSASVLPKVAQISEMSTGSTFSPERAKTVNLNTRPSSSEDPGFVTAPIPSSVQPQTVSEVNYVDPSIRNNCELMDEEPNELQPLLEVRSFRLNGLATENVVVSPKGFWSLNLHTKKVYEYLDLRNPKPIHLILLILILFILIIYFTIKNLDEFIKQSVTFEYQSITILNLNNDGIDSHLTGSIYVNYDDISNFFYRTIFKLSSVAIGSLIIIPKEEIKLYVKPSDLNISPLHVINIFPPELTIDVNNKRSTEVDFISKTEFVKENLVKLSNKLNELNQVDIDLQVQGVLSSTIRSKFYRVDANNLTFYKVFSLSNEKLNPSIEIKELEFSSNDHRISLFSKITIYNELLFKCTLDPINWDLLIKDCEGDLVELGEWRTQSITVEPNLPIDLELNGTVEDVPGNLLTRCEQSKLSIINELIQKCISNEIIEFHLRASKDQNNVLPEWLYYILHNVNYKLRTKLPKQDLLVEDYDINSIDVEVPSTRNLRSEQKFTINLSSNLSMLIENPWNIEFEVSRFKNEFLIKDNNKNSLIKGWSNNFSNLKINNLLCFLDLEVYLNNIEIESLQPKEIGEKINLFINEKFNESLYLDVEFNDVLINLPILTAELNNLRFENIDLLSFLDVKEEISAIDELINQLNVTVYDILYIESKKGKARLSIGSELTNPTNFSVDLPHEVVQIGLVYNRTTFGYLEFNDLFIPKNERFELTAELNLMSETPNDRLVLEYLVSEFISGNDNISLDLTDNRVMNNKGLDELVNEINLSNVKVPLLDFSRPTLKPEQATEDKQSSAGRPHITEQSSSNPFLLEVTIHVLSSEIELTLYNPITNAELMIDLYQACAKYEDVVLGRLQHSQFLIVPPGIYHTPKIPIKISQGIGADILKKVINGQLEVEVFAMFQFRLDKFELSLIYRGSGIKSEIKL